MFDPSQEYAPIGSLKARYRPLGLVAQGQFGKVYCAVHRASGRLVALKLLDRQRSTTSQFLRELSSLLTLRHPALTQLRAIEQTDAGRCLVLDYCPGGTLRQLLESPNLPRQDLMLQCLVQILEGLAHAHGRGIVHCDVKPENILMQLEPQGWRACLTDFGIAQSHFGGEVIGSDPAFERGGSPAYMAPERFAGEAYYASDLYSVGIIVYEVLLGDRPFHGSPNALRDAHRQDPVKFPKPLDIAFQKLLYRALSKSPDLRYESAKAMAQDLRHALSVTSDTLTSRPPANAAYAKFFAGSAPEEVMPWPEAWVTSRPVHLKRQQPIEPVGLAGTVPLLQGLDAASSQSAIELMAVPPAASLGQAALKPQLCIAHGLNLQWLSLDGLDEGMLQPLESPWVTLPEALQDLALGSHFALVLTDTALYRLPVSSGEGANAAASLSLLSEKREHYWSPQCLVERQSGLGQVLLSPQGHWAVLTKHSPRELTSPSPLQSATEDALLLIHFDQTALESNCSSQDLRARKQKIRELRLRPSETLAGVQLLDRRHGAALISSQDGPQRLGLFSRRGQWLSHFILPVSLDYWVRGIPAYELWALEAGQPNVLLKLGLKPFRVERIPVAIAPDQIHPLPWGCVLANQAGEILLLNREGQSLGQLQVPLLADCWKLWLIPMAPHYFVIAMRQGQEIRLLPLDLRQLGLMLVF